MAAGVSMMTVLVASGTRNCQLRVARIDDLYVAMPWISQRFRERLSSQRIV
jgi:hypothetical protein